MFSHLLCTRVLNEISLLTQDFVLVIGLLGSVIFIWTLTYLHLISMKIFKYFSSLKLGPLIKLSLLEDWFIVITWTLVINLYLWHISLILQPRASFKFPYGEISLEQKEEEEEDVKKVFSINGILKGHILNGICSARYKDEDLNLRYCFKVISFWYSIWSMLLLY